MPLAPPMRPRSRSRSLHRMRERYRERSNRYRSRSRERARERMRDRDRERERDRDRGRDRDRERDRDKERERERERARRANNSRSRSRSRDNKDSSSQPVRTIKAPRECRVYVGNLPYTTRWQDLKDFGRKGGEVVHAEVLELPDGRSKGCGIIEYKNEETASAAVGKLQDLKLGGRPVFVREDREDNGQFVVPFEGDQHRNGSHRGSTSTRPSTQSSATAVDKTSEGDVNNGASAGSGSGMNAGATATYRAGFKGSYRPALGLGDGTATSAPAGPADPKRIFVQNLPWHVTWKELTELFQTVGNIIKADVLVYPDTGRSKGTGTVVFESESEAHAAIAKYHGYDWQHRKLEVREDRGRPFGGGGGGGHRFSGGFNRPEFTARPPHGQPMHMGPPHPVANVGMMNNGPPPSAGRPPPAPHSHAGSAFPSPGIPVAPHMQGYDYDPAFDPYNYGYDPAFGYDPGFELGYYDPNYGYDASYDPAYAQGYYDPNTGAHAGYYGEQQYAEYQQYPLPAGGPHPGVSNGELYQFQPLQHSAGSTGLESYSVPETENNVPSSTTFPAPSSFPTPQFSDTLTVNETQTVGE